MHPWSGAGLSVYRLQGLEWMGRLAAPSGLGYQDRQPKDWACISGAGTRCVALKEKTLCPAPRGLTHTLLWGKTTALSAPSQLTPSWLLLDKESNEMCWFYKPSLFYLMMSRRPQVNEGEGDQMYRLTDSWAPNRCVLWRI